MKNLLLLLLPLAVTFNLFGQVPVAPGNGVYGLIAANYQVGSTAQGTTTAKITLQNTTLTKYTATQFRVFYDKIAFTNATVSLIGSTTNLDLQYITNTANGYITITLVYTGGSPTYTLTNGERFLITFTHAAPSVFNNLSSITPLTWTGTQTFQQYASTNAGLDTTLTLHSYGGVFTLPTFTFAGTFTNVTGTGAKDLPLALETRPAGGSTWTQHSAYTTDNSGNFTFTVNLDTTYWDVRLAIKGDTMATGNIISATDAQLINQWVLGNGTMTGFDFYHADVNGSGNITITDAYGVFGRVAGNFTQWPNNVEDVKFFTATEFATVDGSSTNLIASIPGVTNFNYEIIAGQPSTVTFYVLAPGDANETGYHMARMTPIELLIDPTPGVESQIYHVIDHTVEYDFPTSQIEVNVPRLSVEAGNLVNIPVKVLTGTTELNSLQFGLQYDVDVLEFKSVYSTSNAMKWLTYVNASNGEINWGGYDPSVNENPLRNEDEVITLQFLAKQPQAEWSESPLWTTRKFAGNTVSKDLEITPTNGILQVLKSTIGDVINPNSILIYPNPTSEDVTITFNVTTTTDAHLGIYDIQGRKVVAILDGQLPEGQYSYSKNLGQLAPGMYIVNLSLDTETPIYNKLIKQ
jgi:uncharacterized membrane protein